MSDPRREIPSVDALLASPEFEPILKGFPRQFVVRVTRIVIEEIRNSLLVGDKDIDPDGLTYYARTVLIRLGKETMPSLRGVINATGVVLHTNLGRAPLAEVAADAMAAAARGYSNLEYDVELGKRGSRYDHCVKLLRELTGAEDAIVVNNNAAALVLVLNTTAKGKGVAVSRGELVEIGGGFRIPEILERAGAFLVEVGSTNRTRLSDYEDSIKKGEVAAILKVHRSNFRITGFTEDTTLASLADLANEEGIPLLHDLGSGLFITADALALPAEPLASDSLNMGADLVAVSGDKLLGGPQAGIILGNSELINSLRQNPLCRALRVDKVTLAGLEATLQLYRDPGQALESIPTLRMLGNTAESLGKRCEELDAELTGLGIGSSIVESEGRVGGGTYPGVKLPGFALALDGPHGAEALATHLRNGDPPVIARIVDKRVFIDLRTVLPGQENNLVRRVREASNEGFDS
jgi:L-seryl-tRNA(Ser) seleniumtransferase|tara:strand:- start:2265 stop:3662 length:1398 start_codon:yes stop_codon:yes gene_type:complete